MKPLRLLIDPPAGGAWNMAVDEALLESAAAEGIATLRFYQWAPATLSLGYFQAAADRRQHAASQDCPLVRRASGGGAILHDCELTYSIALPQDAARSSATALYERCHESLVEALAQLGASAALYRLPVGCDATLRQNAAEAFLCFQRRTCGDIVLGNWKIAGSAQRRRRGAVLQHGSILLGRSSFAPELPGIRELFGQAFSADSVIDAWLPRLAARLALAPQRGELGERQARRARELVAERFGADRFTQQR